jgi:hypothetical protein
MVLAYFTDAKDDDKCMDGAGVVWTFQGGWWVSVQGNRRRQVDPVVLAKALNPDLEELIGEIS